MTNQNNSAQAATKDIREGFELTYAADADDTACASDLSHFTNGWRACIMSQVGKPVVMKLKVDATAAIDLINEEIARRRSPVAEPAIVGWRDPDCGRMAQKGPPHGYNRYSEALMTVAEHRALMAAALASAPVAGEPFMYGIMGPDGKAHFEEFCVSGDRTELQTEVVDHLNRDNHEDGAYSVVALFRGAAPQASDAAPLLARVLAEWHEEDGPVTWWAWCGHEWAGEAPWCGMPLDHDWPGYHTHWTPLPGDPAALSPTQPAKDGGANG